MQIVPSFPPPAERPRAHHERRAYPILAYLCKRIVHATCESSARIRPAYTKRCRFAHPSPCSGREAEAPRRHQLDARPGEREDRARVGDRDAEDDLARARAYRDAIGLRARRRAARPREGDARALQVPALGGVRARAAQDRDRQDPALQAAPGVEVAWRMDPLEVAGHRLEQDRVEGAAPALVFLHEGLGCVSLWRDFPRAVAGATGSAALVYSRRGYGRSDPSPRPWSLRFMHDEALRVLPAVLDAAGIE